MCVPCSPAPADQPFNGLYGILPRAEFEAQYTPITFAHHARDVRRALTQETAGPHDVLMETVEGHPGMVRVYPADVHPYSWRTMWRKKEKKV